MSEDTAEQSTGEDLALATFTDEELVAALGDLVDEGFYVDLPVLEGLSGEQRSAAITAGARSLLARGFLEPDAEPDDGADTDAQVGAPTATVVGDLAVVLGAIGEPSTVAIAEIEVGGRSWQRAWLTVVGYGVLDHQPDGAGFHRFVLRTPRHAVAAAVDAVDPLAAAAADGEPIERHEEAAEAGWDDVEAALQAPRATARVFSTTPGGGEHELFVIADEDGVWALTGLADGGLRAARVSRERLASVLLTLLGVEEGQ